MEERTGADGFLVPASSRTRLASARRVLALAAVAALCLLVGCGGGDEDPAEPTASSPSASQEATEEKGSSGNEAPASAEGVKGKDGQKAQSSPGSRPGSGQGKQAAPAQLPQGEPEPQATPAEEAQATVADILLTSPALASGSPPSMPAPYTCEGKDSWPALQWQGVPAETKELILFAANLQPQGGEIFFDWAVAGLDPSLGGIEAGQLPKGAIRGANGHGTLGYSICPAKGTQETFVFALHAIPTELSPAKGFDPGELRKRALAQAGNAGVLVFTYSRG